MGITSAVITMIFLEYLAKRNSDNRNKRKLSENFLVSDIALRWSACNERQSQTHLLGIRKSEEIPADVLLA
jgi:hypothetical protein